MEIIHIDDKYKIMLNDGNNGEKFEFKALRYGEEWRNLVGDNLILVMCYKIQELESDVQRLKSELKEQESFWMRECNRD